MVLLQAKAKAWRTVQNKKGKVAAVAQQHLVVEKPRDFQEVKGLLADLEVFFDCDGGDF